MFKRKVRLKITSATRQTLRPAAGILRARCPACEREAEMVTEAEAIWILQAGSTTLERLIDDGRVHAVRTVGGNRWVCKDSLFLL